MSKPSGVIGWAAAALLLCLPVVGLLAPRATVVLFILLSLPLLPNLLQLNTPFARRVLGVLLALSAYPILMGAMPLKSLADVSLAVGLGLLTALWAQQKSILTQQRGFLRRAFAIGYALAVAIIAIEYLFDAPLAHLVAALFNRPLQYMYVYDRGIVILSLLLWPLLLLWQARLPLVLAAVLVCLTLVAATSSQASLLVLAAGGFFYAMASIKPKLAQNLLALAFVLALLTMPFLALGAKALIGQGNDIWPAANSASRVTIWSEAAAAALRNPLLGYGIESSRNIPVVRDHIHPHNGILQIWIEFGLIGILAACTAIIAAARRLQFSPTSMAVAAAWLAVFCVSYNIWQPWWLAMPFMLVAIGLIVQSPQAAAANAV